MFLDNIDENRHRKLQTKQQHNEKEGGKREKKEKEKKKKINKHKFSSNSCPKLLLKHQVNLTSLYIF